jgi:fused signal recognition particle receptor
MPPSAELLLASAIAVLVLSLLVAYWTGTTRQEQRPAVGRGARPSSTAAGTTWTTLSSALGRTRDILGSRLRGSLSRDRGLASWMAEIEEALILADVGTTTATHLLSRLRRRPGLGSPETALAALKEEMRGLFRAEPPRESEGRPLVILVVGINGVGKTTSIGKLARQYRVAGRSVLLVAGDTFRAAAIEQLQIWAERVGCDLVKHQSGADPSAVVFDGLKAARSRHVDVVIVDTAGRLHVKANLMEELKKIVRVIGRELPGAPHETLLVLDGTAGQNTLSQARLFRQALPLTGIVLTKLDGSAKGGAVLAVTNELGLPVRYVGLGEGIDDLREFDPDAFVAALFGEDAAASPAPGTPA